MKSNQSCPKRIKSQREIKAILSLIVIFICIVVLYFSLVGAAAILLINGITLLFHPATQYDGFFVSFLQIMMAFVIIKGMVVWREPEGGIVVTEEEEPELFRIIKEVSEKVGTDMADEVRLYPNSAIGVYETSNLIKIFLPGRRILMLGIATIPSLSIGEFKAILAHEFAHFCRKDTFYNRFIARAGYALINVLSVLKLNIFWVMNPIYWYLYAFNLVFSSLIGNFSRQREFFADEIAAETYGSECFNKALSKYSSKSTIFETMLTGEALVYAREGKYVDNIYEYYRQYSQQLPTHVIESMQQSATIEKTPFGTHPPLRQRIEEVAKLGYPTEEQEDGDTAGVLFRDLPQLEGHMTSLFYSYIFPSTERPGQIVKEGDYQFGFDERRLEKLADEFIERMTAVFNLRLEYSYESLRLLDDLVRHGALLLLKVDLKYLIYLLGSYITVVIKKELGGRWNPYGKDGPTLESVGGVVGLDVEPFSVAAGSLKEPEGFSIDAYFRGVKSRLLSGGAF